MVEGGGFVERKPQVDFYARVVGILNDMEQSPAHNRLEVIKAIAEAKCQPSRRTRRELKAGLVTQEEVEKKVGKCIKRQIMTTWWALRHNAPVSVRGVTVQPQVGGGLEVIGQLAEARRDVELQGALKEQVREIEE